MSDWERVLTVFRSLAALAIGGAFFTIAYALAVRLIGQGSALRRLCAAIISAMWLATVLFHLLIWFGQFKIGMALAALGCLLAAMLQWITPPEALRRQWASDLARFRETRKRILSTGWRRAGFGIVLFFMVLALIRALLLPPLGWDTLIYHGVKAGLWVQQGHPDLFPAPGGWGTKGLLPGGSEVFHAWALLPFHSDLLMGFVDFGFWLALGLIILQFCRGLGSPSATGLVGALYLLFLPSVRMQVGSGYGEMPLMCGIMGGLLFAIHFLRHKDPGSAILSLMAFGVSAGIKTHVWPALAWAALVLGAGVLFQRREIRQKNRPAFLFGVLCAALAALPWLGLNLRAGHPPLSPFSIQVGGLILGESTPTFGTYHGRAEVEAGDPSVEWDAVQDIFQHPFSTWPHDGALTPFVALLGLAGLLRVRQFGAATALLLAGFIGVNALVFWGPSFAVIRVCWSHTSGRFLLPAVVPAFLLGLGWLWTRPSARRITIAVLMIVALIHAGFSTFFGWAAFEYRIIPKTAAVLIVFSAALYALLRFNRRAWLTALIVIASVAAALTALQKERDHLRYKALKQSMVLHWMENQWADGAQVLDDPATPRHLAVTAGIDYNGDNWFLYFFLGRRFQNTLTYIAPTRSGRILDARSWEELAEKSDAGIWLQRIAKAKVDYVVSLPPWSPELKIMESHDRFFWKAEGDGETWGVYAIRAHHSRRSKDRKHSR